MPNMAAPQMLPQLTPEQMQLFMQQQQSGFQLGQLPPQMPPFPLGLPPQQNNFVANQSLNGNLLL